MGWYHMGICWRMKRRCLRRVWASTAVPLGGNGAASSTFTTSICADSTQFMNRHGGSGLMAERAVWQERGGEANVPTPFVWKHGHACTKCIADCTGGRSSLAFFSRNRRIKPSGTAAGASPSLSSSITLTKKCSRKAQAEDARAAEGSPENGAKTDKFLAWGGMSM
jgi:hypothetical protein